jgi:putative methionine-R-sulfoxide reductase with GAF domain
MTQIPAPDALQPGPDGLDGLDGMPVVPVPDRREALDDADVLAAWYDALVASVAGELPGDLLALWACPSAGGAVLVGPAALAADDLRVPVPAPRIPATQCRLLEEILRDARYGSALCLPVRAGRRDVGLLLAGAFRPDAYGARQREVARAVAAQIAPTLARLADPAAPADRHAEEARALARLGRAVGMVQAPRTFAQEAGAALAARLPLERLELLVAGNNPGQSYRLDEHDEGALWSRASLIVPREVLDPRALVRDVPAVLVEDAQADPRWRSWAADGVRSVIAARLVAGGRLQGHLLVATAMEGAYDADDAAFVAGVAPWIAARVEGLVEGMHLRAARAQLAASHAVPNQLRRMATVLATAERPSDALRDYFCEATAVLPFHRVRLVVPQGGDRVAMLVPGDPRAPSELPATPLGEGLVRRVLEGRMPHGAAQGADDVELVFPMHAGGRVVAAMILTTGTPAAFTRAHLALAQQVADTAAWLVGWEVGAAIASS